MSDELQDIAESSGWIPRLERFKAQLAEIVKPDNLAEILYRDRHLKRSEIDDKLMNLGYQLAIRQLIAGVSSGDTRAIDLFMKRHDLYNNGRRSEEPTPGDNAAPYSRPQRDVKVEDEVG